MTDEIKNSINISINDYERAIIADVSLNSPEEIFLQVKNAAMDSLIEQAYNRARIFAVEMAKSGDRSTPVYYGNENFTIDLIRWHLSHSLYAGSAKEREIERQQKADQDRLSSENAINEIQEQREKLEG